jgi:L-alanine-DL-glutamate epimerase-like enolase superfamily enzyme
MKVRSVTPFTVRYPEPHDHNRLRMLTLVRVEAENGATGWGEAVTMFPEACRATEAFIEHGLGALVVGQDALNVEGIYARMLQQVWWSGPQGVAAFAISAIDIALWDLKGRLLGQPVWSLLGGKVRDHVVPTACIHLDMDRVEVSVDEFRAYAAEGYQIVKGGWGSRPENVFGLDRARDIDLAQRSRQAIGESCDLVLDALAARTRWTVKIAAQRLRDLAPYRLRWIEEPLPPSDLESHVALRALTDTAIGTGEQEWTVEGYRRLLAYGAADIVQMDPARSHGITGTRQIIKLLEAHQKPFSLHTWSSSLCTAAGVALIANSPQGVTFDHKPRPSPMQHELVRDPWIVDGGRIAVRDEPGLGVTVREETVTKYRI